MGTRHSRWLRFPQHPAWRIALFYVLIGGLWIPLSDYLAAVLFPDHAQYVALQSYKGWAFVVLSALALFFLLRHELQRRERVEEALKTSQEYAQNIIGSSLDMIIAVNNERRIIEFNQAAQDAFGYAQEEVLGTHVDVLYASPQSGLAIHKTAVEKGRCIEEILNRRKNGEAFSSFLSASPLRDAQGKVVGVMGVSRDITEQKKAEAELQRVHRALRTICECNQTLVHAEDEATLLHEICRIIVEVGGYRLAWVGFAEQDADKSVRPVAHMGDDEGYLQSINITWADSEQGRGPTGTAIRSGQPCAMRDLLTEPRYAPWRAEALKRGYASSLALPLIASGQPLGAVNIYAGEPDAFSAEEVKLLGELADDLAHGLAALRVKEERLRLSRAVEQAVESIMIAKPDGTIVYVNPAFERISGYTRQEVIGQNPRLLKSGRHGPEFYQEMWAALTKGETWSGHIINRGKDGSLFEEEAIFSPVYDAAGKLINYVAVKRDVTQEMKLQTRLQQSQKMEAVGTLAGGIAHDFNNLLTVIIGYAEISLRKDPGPAIHEYLVEIHKQGERAAQLIAQLLAFSRKAVTEKQPLELLPLLKETLKMLERTVPENVSIQLKTPDKVALVNADPTQIQQVIMNLAINASHAMPHGGKVFLSLEDLALDEAYCQQYPYAKPGSYTCLSVQDTGIGMTPEVQARIFEPFFTTKERGEGTGLGLAMVYGIVKTHEGHITVYSEVGHGSEFKVYLPAMEEGASRPAELAQAPFASGAETILLVEDQEAVLGVGRKMLEALGYRLLTAVDGVDAFKVYCGHQGEIDLVVADIVMPKMGGQELYEVLSQVNPKVRMLLMSGYSSLGEDVAELRKKGIKGFVQKPFNFNRLGRVVRQALDEEEQAAGK